MVVLVVVLIAVVLMVALVVALVFVLLLVHDSLVILRPSLISRATCTHTRYTRDPFQTPRTLEPHDDDDEMMMVIMIVVVLVVVFVVVLVIALTIARQTWPLGAVRVLWSCSSS